MSVTIDVEALIRLRRYAMPCNAKLNANAARFGARLSTFHGRGMDFAETRHYQVGDDSRHIEWRVTARTGKPHIKVFQEERERPTILLVDFSSSMYFGTQVAFKSVIAAQLAALIAWTAAISGDRVGALLCSHQSHHEFMPRSRQAGVLPILQQLANYTLQSPSMHANAVLFNALTRLQRVVKAGSRIILLSDFYTLNTPSKKLLYNLRQHNDLLAYWVQDPVEVKPPKPNLYAITNGHTTQTLDLIHSQSSYQDYCDTRNKQVHDYFKELRMSCVNVKSTDDLALIVRQTLPRRWL